jgi:hypothetical protein
MSRRCAQTTGASLAEAQQVANEIAANLGTTNMVTLETTSAALRHSGPGRQWSGPVYVATPQLLKAFGIISSEVNPDADILTKRPSLSTMSGMQLVYGSTGVGANGGNGGTSARQPLE